MKQLIIIGARGFGREVHYLAKQCIGYGTQFVIKGFLDDKYSALDGFDNYAPILGSVEEYNIQADDVFICALGSVKWKKFYCELIENKGGQFINLIHHSVTIRENVRLGKGLIIGEYCIISCDIAINDFVTIHSNCVIGHDVVIGRYAQMGAFCFIGGFTCIKEEVTIYVRSTILDKVTIGGGAVVGAASVVIKNVKPGITVFGNPAKMIF
jgi:sugar O-acyltransferase (sialic acid O-acetyltransferase NeuD family)